MVGASSRDEVVVVRVEPLDHLHRGDVEAGALGAARHREVGVEVDLAIGRAAVPVRAVPAVARRHGADRRDGVEHLVVVREGVRGDQVDPGVTHPPPGLEAERARGLLQLRSVDLAVPIPLDGALQLAPRADARVAGDGGQGPWAGSSGGGAAAPFCCSACGPLVPHGGVTVACPDRRPRGGCLATRVASCRWACGEGSMGRGENGGRSRAPDRRPRGGFLPGRGGGSV